MFNGGAVCNWLDFFPEFRDSKKYGKGNHVYKIYWNAEKGPGEKGYISVEYDCHWAKDEGKSGDAYGHLLYRVCQWREIGAGFAE